MEELFNEMDYYNEWFDNDRVRFDRMIEKKSKIINDFKSKIINNKEYIDRISKINQSIRKFNKNTVEMLRNFLKPSFMYETWTFPSPYNKDIHYHIILANNSLGYLNYELFKDIQQIIHILKLDNTLLRIERDEIFRENFEGIVYTPNNHIPKNKYGELYLKHDIKGLKLGKESFYFKTSKKEFLDYTEENLDYLFASIHFKNTQVVKRDVNQYKKIIDISITWKGFGYLLHDSYSRRRSLYYISNEESTKSEFERANKVIDKDLLPTLNYDNFKLLNIVTHDYANLNTLSTINEDDDMVKRVKKHPSLTVSPLPSIANIFTPTSTIYRVKNKDNLGDSHILETCLQERKIDTFISPGRPLILKYLMFKTPKMDIEKEDVTYYHLLKLKSLTHIKPYKKNDKILLKR